MSSEAQASAQGGGVDISQLPLQQLQQIKAQLDSEVSHLTSSYSSLRSARGKFQDCIASIAAGVRAGGDKPLLVPLTSSLYVPGTLADSENVLVDVGTGFYVEKSCDEATAFYEGKVKELGESVKGLEEVVGKKRGSLRMVEEVLRQKMLAQQQR